MMGLFILTVVGTIFKGCIYRTLVNYQSVGIRSHYSATNKQLTELIENKSVEETKPEIKTIIQLALSITSEQLVFTSDHNDTDPNQLILSNKAHCVGYAAFFTTTMHYLLKKYGLENKWVIIPRVGQLHVMGINIHPYFHSSFFKDHDFVTIENKSTGEIFAVDPTLNDYFFIDFVTYSK